jgi:uncharacterized membrane protein YdfJ with MMPL/SSD domain
MGFSAIFAFIVVTVGVAILAVAPVAQERTAPVPRFEIDPFWPKVLPNNWEMGELGAVFVDANDHIWVISRPRTLTADQIGASLTRRRLNAASPRRP